MGLLRVFEGVIGSLYQNSVLAQGLWEAIGSHWGFVVVVAGLLVLVVTASLILDKYVHICTNIFDTMPPLAVGFRHNGHLPGEPVDFTASDGHALRGTLIPGRTDQSPKGLIVFAPELGSDRGSCLRYCSPLLEAGYDIFAFDFRGHGESSSQEGYRPCQWPTDRERADMLGAIAWVEDYLESQGRPRELGILGVSRGAGAAILASVGLSQVKGIVADGAFSTDTTLEYFMKRWAGIFAKVRFVYENHPPLFWRFMRWRVMRNAGRRYGCHFPSVRKALARLNGTAILLIHGQKDSYIPVSQSQFLYALASPPKYLWVVSGARHNESATLHPAQYAEQVVRFFNEHLMTSDPIVAARHKALATNGHGRLRHSALAPRDPNGSSSLSEPVPMSSGSGSVV